MISLLIQLFTFTNLNNELFIQEHNALNLSYKVGENQFLDRNYTDEYYVDNSMKFFSFIFLSTILGRLFPIFLK